MYTDADRLVIIDHFGEIKPDITGVVEGRRKVVESGECKVRKKMRSSETEMRNGLSLKASVEG